MDLISFYIFCVYMMTSEATIILVIKLTITSRNMILNFLWIIINKIASVLWTWLQGFNHLQLTSDNNLQTCSQCQPQNSFKTTHKPTNYIVQLMNSLFFSVTFLPLIVCRDKNSQKLMKNSFIVSVKSYKINRTMQKYWLQDV